MWGCPHHCENEMWFGEYVALLQGHLVYLCLEGDICSPNKHSSFLLLQSENNSELMNEKREHFDLKTLDLYCTYS